MLAFTTKLIKECPLKAFAKAVKLPSTSSPIKDLKGKSSERLKLKTPQLCNILLKRSLIKDFKGKSLEPKAKDTSIVQSPPKKKSKEIKKDKDFTSIATKKNFKQKKNQDKKPIPNYYSLVEKPDLSKEEEDMLEFVPTT